MTVYTISSNVETKSNPVHFLIKTTSNSEYCQQTWNFSPPISQVSWAPEYLVTSTRVLCGSEQQGSFNPSVSQSHNNDNMTIVTTPSHLWTWKQRRRLSWTRFHWSVQWTNTGKFPSSHRNSKNLLSLIVQLSHQHQEESIVNFTSIALFLVYLNDIILPDWTMNKILLECSTANSIQPRQFTMRQHHRAALLLATGRVHC